MASRGIADGRCKIFEGRKFPGNDPELKKVLASDTTFLLYPGPEALPLDEAVRKSADADGSATFVLLDGTWDEAKKVWKLNTSLETVGGILDQTLSQIFVRNPSVQRLPRVRLDTGRKSRYVVRTQPDDSCLSTVETVAETLAVAEGRPELADLLCAPLDAMCNFQINHGSVHHDAKAAATFREQNTTFVKKNNWKRRTKH